ncbi:MAG: cytochrome C oxidase subunit I, partial [Saprospiraceae bacterium]|nr:cytochrome C oxidase subunit I [Saprospiraceae bacterium]
MKIAINRSEKTLYLVLLAVPMVLLSLGIYHGLLQTLYRSGMISQESFAALDYYQGLTLHGVINAIVLTTFFAVAFGHACISYYLKIKVNMTTAWLSATLMLVGSVMAAWAMLAGEASVLYTFYPPMKAHPLFYLGAALLVVGSWVAFFGWITQYRAWRKENPVKKIPLPVLATLVNFTIWFVCSLSVAYEILFLLLPWSMGITETVNVPLSRTLFWFFGHALVYFWLLPVYTMYYAMLPKLAGGKLYSDNAGRLVFFLFLILSIPVGTHHQFGDPSITKGIKLVHSILTYGVAVPSFITAFTIAASLEYSSWVRGFKKGWVFGWIFKLPYFDKERYLFAYLIAGLILFIFGGFTGLVNASYSLNNVVHNTAWIPGHFHMTIAGPVFLGILGMSLYMLEKVTGKDIAYKRIATIVPYLWTVGMLTFSVGLSVSGLLGAPRRTNMGLSYLNPDSPLFRPDWVLWETLGVVGGCMMFAA